MKKIFDKNRTLGAFLSYSFLFLVLILIINFLFYQYHNAFIWNYDNVNIHLNSFIYFRDFLINLFKTGNLRVFTWNIGLGTNMLPNLVGWIGDIFSYISVFFAKSDLERLYQLLIFFRLYFVGFSFIIYSKYKKNSNHASVAGGLIYTFSIFSLYFMLKSPYILNLMILLPLLMIGIEKIILDNKKSFFILISFLISITNIYFIPIIFIYILLYSSVLIWGKYRLYGFKLVFSAYLRVIFSYLIGLLLLGFILIPLIYQLININIDLSRALSLSNYQDLILVYLGANNQSLFVGINGIFLLYFPLAIKKFKGNKELLILLILLYIVLIFINKYNFSNYLGFILVFVFSSIISNTIDLYSNLSKSDFKWIITFIFINIILVLGFNRDVSNVLISFIPVFGLLLVLLNKKELSKYFKLVFSLVLVISISISIYNYYDLSKNDFNIINNMNNIDAYYVDNGNEISGFKDSIMQIKEDDDFYRITKDSNKLHNASIYYGFNALDGEYLFKSNKYDELSKDLANFAYTDTYLGNFDNRTKINSLLGIKYYLADKKYYVPRSYSEINKVNDTFIFKNDYFVNFGAFYDRYISLEEYNSLKSLEKESSLMKYVVLNESDIDLNYVSKSDDIVALKDSIKNIGYEFNDEIKDKQRIVLMIEENDLEGELYLRITNFKTSKKTNILVKHKDAEYSKEILDEQEILINLTSYRDIDGNVEIDFNSLGEYSFDDIELLVVSFDDYESDVSKLNSSNFDVLEYDAGQLKGKVNLSKKGILQFATTYNDDFNVYVDGKKVDTLEVNKYFLGIYIDEGEHIVELKYNISGGILGICMSGLGIVIFSMSCIFEIKKRKKRK